jgi:hypothetical protein
VVTGTSGEQAIRKGEGDALPELERYDQLNQDMRRLAAMCREALSGL